MTLTTVPTTDPTIRHAELVSASIFVKGSEDDQMNPEPSSG